MRYQTVHSTPPSVDRPLNKNSLPTHLIQIDHWLPELILQLVEIPHAHFSKVTGMVLVEIRSVMMLSTSHTSSTRMLSVLSNTAMACRHVSAMLAGLRQSSRHCCD